MIAAFSRFVDVLAEGEDAAAEPDQNEQRAREKPDNLVDSQEDSAQAPAPPRAMAQPGF